MLQRREVQHGMSWIEFAAVVVLLSVLSVFLAQRLVAYQELAERADMEYGATVLKSALRMRLSAMMVEGRMQETAQLVCENPVRWLDKSPPNYYGEAHGEAVKAVTAGSWYFDPAECSMGYMVRHDGGFKPDSQGMKRVRYRVKSIATDAKSPPVGLRFELIEPYDWAGQ
jgi:hypothetical protein